MEKIKERNDIVFCKRLDLSANSSKIFCMWSALLEILSKVVTSLQMSPSYTVEEYVATPEAYTGQHDSFPGFLSRMGGHHCLVLN